MRLTPDAMTILVGLLNDVAIIQRKIEAGRGATCDVNLDECEGEFIITFGATIDPQFVSRPDGQES
jgi:hypothetical protein